MICFFFQVKPGPVEGLHSEVLGSGSAQVTWKYPKDMSPTNPYTILEYEMVVTAEKGWDTRTQVCTDFTIIFTFLNQTLWCDLHKNRLHKTIPMSGHTIGLC